MQFVYDKEKFQLIIECTEHDFNFVPELIELIKNSFMEALGMEPIRISSDGKIKEDCPKKHVINMIIYYNSRGKFRDIISDYSISLTREGVRVLIKIDKIIEQNTTPNQMDSKTSSKLRIPMWWENYGKKFYELDYNFELIRKHLREKSIMKCYYQDKLYFFNIGINEPFVTDSMIEDGRWFVYSEETT